jgi:transcriptional regulator
MQAIWQLEKAFVKEVVALLPHAPHYNTISTVVRKLEEKGYVAHEAFGKTHRYYPLIQKEDYRSTVVSGTMKNYFNNSYKTWYPFLPRKKKSARQNFGRYWI